MLKLKKEEPANDFPAAKQIVWRMVLMKRIFLNGYIVTNNHVVERLESILQPIENASDYRFAMEQAERGKPLLFLVNRRGFM
ncbi:MAG: serine protease [Candidatus Jettenia sp.]|nr:MAG: serine protease [Candidatus Jettenia sp. AMX1]MBC6927344.1 serine protease [Candidatus Jettenia sp.]MCE7879027.1 serine protease [Candidatus Jettenia sp. AMX1]MCQ3925773.1 hypothetical protein [Candidatus Jettenia sp.]